MQDKYVLIGMTAVEYAVGHELQAKAHKQQRHYDAYSRQQCGEQPLRHFMMLSYQPLRIFRHEHCHERIARHQINTALAARYAIEHKDQQKRQPREHLHWPHVFHCLAQTLRTK